MKLDPRFKSEDNKLFFLDGTPVDLKDSRTVDASWCADNSTSDQSGNKSPFCVKLPWTLVGLDEESYNENFLALFRDWLKKLEEAGVYAYIIPVADSDVSTQEKKEALTASMKHAARRIKDCESVIGFAVPEEADAEFFRAELSQKHAQYIFFSRNEKLLQDKSIVSY